MGIFALRHVGMAIGSPSFIRKQPRSGWISIACHWNPCIPNDPYGIDAPALGAVQDRCGIGLKSTWVTLGSVRQ